MRTFEFKPQSPKWDRYTVELPDDSVRQVGQTQMWAGRATVSVTTVGNSNWVTVTTDEGAEQIAVLLVQWDGKVIESQRAPVKGLVDLYMANTRNWSGGGCWRGVAIGREGALLALGCSGGWEYYEVVGGQWVKSRPPAAQ